METFFLYFYRTISVQQEINIVYF